MLQPTRLADAPTLRGARGRPTAASRWINARLNDAATGMARLSDRLRRRRRLLVVEQADGAFALASQGRPRPIHWRNGEFSDAPSWRGADVDLRLNPARCVFRELELPARAADFLEGVVRAQIDRVTPWRSNEVAFGWSKPAPREGERIAVWIAAAKRAPIVELAEAATGANSVVVTSVRADGALPIEIYSRRGGAASRVSRWRLALIALLFAAIGAGLAALVAQVVLGAAFDNQIAALNADLAKRRAELRQRDRTDEPIAQALAARRRAAPSVVVTLEALSRILPDEAYLTEMRLEGAKLEIAGVAVNAADLIHAIESSPHFAHATFTAPTTRASENEREIFRIEAQVAPRFTVSP